ncbi:MAG TPA: helix-turn-helix domain-containing protein [Propionicimonas sp.]|jgi:DNA-binding PucR family transcriptional regulator|nr:helix-turn-helix domain-containing protein [Propionicimonas sp.]
MTSTGTEVDTWWPAAPEREQIAGRLRAAAAELTTAAMARIAESHPWFALLDAEHRSWITVVARAGIDGFVRWFAAGGEQVDPGSIFDAAPRALTRRITLHQTVDLVRTTIETVERQLSKLPVADQPALRLGIVHYSREVAFGAAEVYARAAEARGAWDARLEAMVVDAVIRGDADETVASRASTLGWSAPAGVAVVIGGAPAQPGQAIEAIRQVAGRHAVDVLAAQQGDRLVVLLGGRLVELDLTALVGEFEAQFGAGQVVIGPVVDDLSEAVRSARAALSGMRAGHAWPDAPRPVAANDLLPERVLAGDGHARRQLAGEVYRPLLDAGGDLIGTLSAFLEHGGSVEGTARALYIHANTVRYRLRRVQDITGYAANDPREAYVLQLALTLGRLLG